ncbi:hypothetical protein BpHYR1_018151 [Brachionus plicatilis]|uniref:Uncharacterized protein n=1 Tax=Brachionus plicatilis TaxID=10195 RepID=A0A3M7QDD7_BRAPC|nr:hypothetical protein BpHYR1_018151 [Brachionus plicatilis]
MAQKSWFIGGFLNKGSHRSYCHVGKIFILIFISNTGIEILQKAEEYHLDGTFKNASKQFYQILTDHAVIDKITYVCEYIFSENKNTQTYAFALEQLRNIVFPKNRTEFAVYFEKLTHRVMHPFEQDLDNEVNQEDDEESEEDEAIIEQTVSKIKVAKLKKDYKNFDFVGNFQEQLKSQASEESKNDVQQSIAQEQLKSQPSKSNKRKTQEIESESKKSKFEPEQLRVKQEAIPQPSSSNQNSQIYPVDDNVQVETFSFFLSDNQWLMGRHIDLAFDSKSLTQYVFVYCKQLESRRDY